MSPLDIIEIPGYPGLFARRVVVEMWQRAGSPRINDAGRLYSTQKAARVAFLNGTGSPADDPDRPDIYPLAHVRFAALDVVNSARSAMIAAGFEYPYDYEPWHGQLPNIYSYPLVTSIPASASDGATDFPTTPILKEEADMAYAVRKASTGQCFTMAPGFVTYETVPASAITTRNVLTADDKWIELNDPDFDAFRASLQIPSAAINVITAPGAKVRKWSQANDAVERADAILAKLDAAVVTPPKA